MLPKTGEEIWIPLVHAGELLFPGSMERRDTNERGRIGGLLLVRDWVDKASGGPAPWLVRTGDLTHLRPVAEDMIRAADPTLTHSFRPWRHTGMTELGDAAPTDAQSRAINRHGSARTLPRYVRKTRRRIIAGAHESRLTRTDRADLSE